MPIHEGTIVVIFSLTSARGRKLNKKIGYITGSDKGLYNVTLLPSLNAQGLIKETGQVSVKRQNFLVLDSDADRDILFAVS